MISSQFEGDDKLIRVLSTRSYVMNLNSSEIQENGIKGIAGYRW